MTVPDTDIKALLVAEKLPAGVEESITKVYSPLAQRIEREARSSPAPFIVGLCGPQGSGKSTIARILRVLLQAHGLRTVVLSLDDLYLTRAERAALAERIHPLLQTRGVPGTHDVQLGLHVVEALGMQGEILLPAFDKATDDRRSTAMWSHVTGPVDVVLFEGWCVGAVAQPPPALNDPVNELERELDTDGRWRRYVNDALATSYRTLFDKVSFLVLLMPPAFETVYAWRGEQEQRLREQLETDGGDTSRLMNAAELHRFIAHYERLTRHILLEMPARANVVIDLDAQRVPQWRR